jgi:hypothetical protein
VILVPDKLMPISTRHPLRPVLVALATLAGLLLVPSGASAGCEAMKSAGTCPPSMIACCCSKATAEADAQAIPEVDESAILSQEVSPAAGTCSCEGRPEAPAEPAPKPARVTNDSRTDRGGTHTIELPDLRPSPFPPGSHPAPVASPPHVPLYLRNSRFLI